ncbi:MAG: phasin family protein [Bifidobacterium sp.]|nr:phasin family protein [Bifidobacterium sp.]
MADDNKNSVPDFGEGLRKVFLAGVGALATTADKGREIINDLVQRGELTVDQGKKLNSELSHKASATAGDLKDQAKAAGQTMRDAAAGLRAQTTDNLDDLTKSDAADEAPAADDNDAE